MEEQNDFDKLFGSNLPNFADKDWRNLEGQLDRHDLKKQFTRLLWALPALGGVFMAISGMLYYQLNQTRQQVRSLEDKLVSTYEKRPAQPEISPQKIILHDTVYRQVVVRQIIRDIQPLNSNITNNPENNNNLKYDNTYTENQIVSEREKFIGIHNLTSKSPILNTSEKGITNDFSKLNPVVVPEDSFVTENHFSLIPKSVTVGVLGGIQKPVGNDFDNGGGADFGVRTVLGYHNSKGQERWGVVLDFQENNLFFVDKNRVRIEQYGTKPTGAVRRAERVDIGRFSSFKVGMGLRYNFLFSEKIKPYFGANWNFQIPAQYSAEVHFDDQTKQNVLGPQESTLHLLGINTGLNVLLSKHLALNGELYYQSQLFNNSLNTVDASVLGGRIGMSYRFGK
jgi:hypothetical protein